MTASSGSPGWPTRCTRTASPIDRFQISYDLRKKLFVPTPRGAPRGDVIPLPVIFDLRQVLRWSADHPEAADHVDEVNEITQTIRQFQVPAYEVDQDEPQVLEDIFDRLNNYGKRLTRAEIFSALFAGNEEDKDDTPALDRIAQDISDDLDFGLIDNDTVLQAILGRRAPDVLRQIRTEFGPDARVSIDVPEEDRDTAYRPGEEALRRTVHFLQTVAGVPHFTLLPYKYLLVVLTRLFAHYPELGEHDQLLVRRWFWRAAMVGPEIFCGNTTGAVRLHNRAIQPGDLEGSIQRLLELVPGRRSARPISPGSAATRPPPNWCSAPGGAWGHDRWTAASRSTAPTWPKASAPAGRRWRRWRT